MGFTILRNADAETEAGAMRCGDGLESSREGMRVRLVDGPFMETRERVAGVGVIDVASREAALARLRRRPDCRNGWRPNADRDPASQCLLS